MKTLMITIFLLGLVACSPKSAESPAHFTLSVAALTGEQQFAGGVMIRALNQSSNEVRDVLLEEEMTATFPNGVGGFTQLLTKIFSEKRHYVEVRLVRT